MSEAMKLDELQDWFELGVELSSDREFDDPVQIRGFLSANGNRHDEYLMNCCILAGYLSQKPKFCVLEAIAEWEFCAERDVLELAQVGFDLAGKAELGAAVNLGLLPLVRADERAWGDD